MLVRCFAGVLFFCFFLFVFFTYERAAQKKKTKTHTCCLCALTSEAPLSPESFRSRPCKLEAGMRLKVKAFQFYLTPSLWFNMKPACVQMITESKRLTSIGLTDCLCVCVCVCERWSVCMHTCMFRGGVWLWLHMSVRVCNCVCVCVCVSDRQTDSSAGTQPACQWMISETCYTNNPLVIVFSEDGLFDYWNSLGPLITCARHFQANLHLRPV